MTKWNCLVNHGGNPCTCFDFNESTVDKDSSELSLLRSKVEWLEEVLNLWIDAERLRSEGKPVPMDFLGSKTKAALRNGERSETVTNEVSGGEKA